MTHLEFCNTIDSALPQMYRSALAIAGNEADAADAVHDTVLRLWDNRHKLKAAANPKAYCAGAARNAALDQLRSRPPVVAIDGIPEPGSGSDPAAILEQSENIRRIELAIAALPRNQRIVMTMRDLEGRPMAEIASETGLSPANVKTLLCRARAVVRKLFQ